MTAAPDESERARLAERRAALAQRYLRVPEERPTSNARGIHHAALICSDVERTIQFYDGLLGFPVVEITENRDYPGSTHFFFDQLYQREAEQSLVEADRLLDIAADQGGVMNAATRRWCLRDVPVAEIGATSGESFLLSGIRWGHP